MINTLLFGYLIGKTFYDIDQSIEYDKIATENFKNAFLKLATAKKTLSEKETFCDRRLNNVVKKKNAIINYTIPKFVEVYQKIQKVIVNKNKKIQQLTSVDSEDYVKTLNILSSLKDNSFSSEQLVCGCMLKGIGKMIKLTSQQNLASSENMLSMSVLHSKQIDSICMIYDAVINRADRIAKLLTKMNALFILSIQQTSETINKNGYDIYLYSDQDCITLSTCLLMAQAIVEIINIPVVNLEGEITEEAVQMLAKGEEYLIKYQEILSY